MNLSLGNRWEKFVEEAVRTGRYASVSEVVREGLRLVEEREVRLQSLRGAIAEGIESGFTVDDAALDRSIEDKMKELKSKGY